ncbi:hypothetical protein EB796_010711 [Bugula neritina]|uniref:Uncharacterized protein n=1 Tax=Bugula neritina TaxID=10212 RepID=A0A7J7K051_BUGNE|nr:hypothetical protein EB796_010711 [Bugula neritina]
MLNSRLSSWHQQNQDIAIMTTSFFDSVGQGSVEPSIEQTLLIINEQVVRYYNLARPILLFNFLPETK